MKNNIKTLKNMAFIATFALVLLCHLNNGISQSITSQMKKENETLYQKTLNMPFNQQLVAGTLPRDKFAHYLQQDSLYLIQYSKALAILAAKAETDEEALFLLEGAKGCLQVEKSMHASYLALLHTAANPVKPTLITQAYTDFLLAAAYHQPYEIGLAAILPCYLIYQHIGSDMKGKSKPDNFYGNWINTYSNAVFTKNTLILLGYINRQHNLKPASGALMKAHYSKAVQFEYLFWQSAYNKGSLGLDGMNY